MPGRQQIVDMLRDRGDHELAARAERELPDEVHPQTHAAALADLGINAADLPGEIQGADSAPGEIQ